MIIADANDPVGSSFGDVGIGTLTPSQKLDVEGYVKASGFCIGADCKTDWINNLYEDANGNIGIGIAAPEKNLHVKGDDGIRINSQADTYEGDLRMVDTVAELTGPKDDLLITGDGGILMHLDADNDGVSDGLKIYDGDKTELVVVDEATGDVTIGTPGSDSKLIVDGDIETEGDIILKDGTPIGGSSDLQVIAGSGDIGSRLTDNTLMNGENYGFWIGESKTLEDIGNSISALTDGTIVSVISFVDGSTTPISWFASTSTWVGSGVTLVKPGDVLYITNTGIEQTLILPWDRLYPPFHELAKSGALTPRYPGGSVLIQDDEGNLGIEVKDGGDVDIGGNLVFTDSTSTLTIGGTTFTGADLGGGYDGVGPFDVDGSLRVSADNGASDSFILGPIGVGTSDPQTSDPSDPGYNGMLDVEGDIRVGDAMVLRDDNDVGNSPDIDMFGNGLIASEQNLYINIDSNADSTSDQDGLIIRKNSRVHDGGIQLMRVGEDGKVTIGTAANAGSLEVLGDITLGTDGILTLGDGNSFSSIPELIADINAAGGTSGVGLWAEGTNEIYYTGGEVGIGTNAPGGNLDIKGGGAAKDITITGNHNFEYFRLSEEGGNDPGKLELMFGGATQIQLATGDDSYINTGNKLGIGTTTPDDLLDVSGSGNAGLVVQTTSESNDDVARLTFKHPRPAASGGGMSASTISMNLHDLTINADERIHLGTNGREDLNIDSVGKVGIGISNPQTRLQIGDGTADVSNSITFGNTVTTSEGNLPRIQHMSVLDPGATNDLAIGTRSTSGGLLFYTGNGDFGTGSANRLRMVIDSNGAVKIGSASDPGSLEVLGDITLGTGGILTLGDGNSFSSITELIADINAAGGTSGGYAPDGNGNLDVGTGNILLDDSKYVMWDNTATGGRIGYYGVTDTLDIISGWNTADDSIRFGTGVAGGTWNTRMVIAHDGDVGIGVNPPTSKLDVAGTIKASASGTAIQADGNIEIYDETANSYLIIKNSGGTSTQDDNLIIFKDSGDGTNFMVGQHSDGGPFEISKFGSTNPLLEIGTTNDFKIDPTVNGFVYDDSTDRVGIGTDTPSTALEVVGDITIGGVGSKLIFNDGTNPAVELTASSIGAMGALSTDGNGDLVTGGPMTIGGGLYFEDTGASGMRISADTTNDFFNFLDGNAAEGMLVENIGIDSTYADARDNLASLGGPNSIAVKDNGYFGGKVGIGTMPTATFDVVNTANADGFKFSSGNVLTGEKDLFTIIDGDSGGGGQDESSSFKVLRTGSFAGADDGSSLVELTYTGGGLSGADEHFYILGRRVDEGAVEWGVNVDDSDIWTTGSIRGGATGTDCGGTNAACFNSPTFKLADSGDSFINGGSLGIGTTNPDASVMLELQETADTTNAAILFDHPGVNSWTVGMDKDDSHKFKIAQTRGFATNTKLTLDGTGLVVGDGTGSVTAGSLVLSDVTISSAADIAAAAGGGGINYGDCEYKSDTQGASDAGSSTISCSAGKELVDHSCSIGAWQNPSVGFAAGQCYLSGVNSLMIIGNGASASGSIKCCATS
tara:strand:- start:16895 stop:21535 length:4641 start_codon:yes stop_codon:yes gene_type:complete